LKHSNVPLSRIAANDGCRGCAGSEHAKKAEDKVPGMVCLDCFSACAVVGKRSEFNILAMAVARVVRPSSKNPFSTVGLANILLAIGGGSGFSGVSLQGRTDDTTIRPQQKLIDQ
jgi:hypothetical protein